MMRHIYNYPVNFTYKRVEEIVSLIEEMNPEITFLTLNNSNLGDRKRGELETILDAITRRLPNLRAMNLADNHLGRFTSDQMFGFFPRLSKLKYLDLRNNHLGNYSIDKLVFVIDNLQNLDHLDLGNNYLASVKKLELMFRTNRKGPRNLGLSGNNLGMLSGEILSKFFSSIPNTVNILDLRFNGFLSMFCNHGVNFQDLINAINRLTKNLSLIDLRANMFLENKISFLISHLPENIKKVGVNNEIREVHDLWAEKILDEVYQKIVNSINGNYAFDEILLPVKIDERILNRYIANLEKCKHELSSLTCGLLLQGKIPTILRENVDKRAYCEKRLHDAITFYTKAAEVETVRTIALGLLWQIKTKTTIPSIKNRLAQYDLSDVMKYKQFPLASRSGLFSVQRNLCQQIVLASPQSRPGL